MKYHYWPLYFAQGEDGCEALDRLDELGAEAWLSEVLPYGDEHGEASDTRPWGSADAIEYREPADASGGEIIITTNRSLGYIAVTQRGET